jgi:hypothetical protein
MRGSAGTVFVRHRSTKICRGEGGRRSGEERSRREDARGRRGRVDAKARRSEGGGRTQKGGGRRAEGGVQRAEGGAHFCRRPPRSYLLWSEAMTRDRYRSRTNGFTRFQSISDPRGSETRLAWDGIRELVHGIWAEFWTEIPCHSKRRNSGPNSRIPDSTPNSIHPNEA